MKNCILVWLIFFSLPAFAQHNFGAGVVIGNPTGLTAKYNLSGDKALDAAISWAGHLDFYLHATYLWIMPELFQIDRFPVNWYVGAGGRILDHDDHRHSHWLNGREDHDGDDTHVGIRAPIGLRMNFNDPRIELFVELSLTLDLIPDMDADLDAGIGGRYYF